jgi:UDP-N-acetyl-D-mannosaminuronate dehydrogenase
MEDRIMKKDYTIAVAGTGYVGLSIATLSQHHLE